MWNNNNAIRQSRRLFAAAAILSLFAVACGGDSSVDPLPQDLPPSPGQGTGTLRVNVEVQGRDDGSGGFETEFLATVSDTLGGPVSASVVVSGRFGDVKLTETVTGTYSALRGGYELGSYTLDVTSDAGSVTGVTVRAPVVHAITTPVSGETVEAGAALLVRWTRSTPAAECRLETRDYDSDWIFGDTGTLYVPSVGNPPRDDQRIRIKRRNNQTPAGALPGSNFSVRIRRTVEPVIAQ